MKLSQLIASKGFDWVNPSITEEAFPLPTEPLRTEYKVYSFDKGMESEEVIEVMKKDGFFPATVYELLSWEGWDGKNWVVALGSVAKVGRNRCVACLGWRDLRRDLNLRWFDRRWDRSCRFLAVRNSESQKKPSDSVALCPHCNKKIKIMK